MRARLLGSMALTAAVAIVAACSGGGATDTLPGAGRMSAMIGDTLLWRANLDLRARLVDSVFELEGLERSGKFTKLSVRGVAIDSANMTAVRSFVFSFVDAETAGYALYTELNSGAITTCPLPPGIQVFTTDVSGGAGRVTFTLLTAERAVGTFTFTASRSAGCDPIRRFGSGVFDVKF